MAKMVCNDVGDLPPEPLVIEDGLVNQQLGLQLLMQYHYYWLCNSYYWFLFGNIIGMY